MISVPDIAVVEVSALDAPTLPEIVPIRAIVSSHAKYRPDLKDRDDIIYLEELIF